MQLYNTLTRQKEEFKPLKPPSVRLYTCGPTVYNTAHIGNLRAYLFMDSLRRVLKRAGYTLTHCMNITDVGHLTDDGDDGEDKMAVAVRRERIDPWAVAARYTEQFMADIGALAVDKPEIIAKATGHISDMIDFVRRLEQTGFAYETNDGVYFSIDAFPAYGRLSGLDLSAQKAGARVEVNSQKRNPSDFALWKKADPSHLMQWPSPWGQGYPGWHIECSALGLRFLGETFDIHTGGADHIPVHHENEIAQSTALLGHPAVNIWMHNEFVLVDNGKMSKSLGNAYTLDDLRSRGFAPRHYRYLCANAHYRSKLNFTWEALQGAKTACDRFVEAAAAHREQTSSDHDAESLLKYIEAFDQALYDDLNIPKALGIAHQTVKLPRDERVYQALLSFDEILQLGVGQVEDALPPALAALMAEREQARADKDWAKSDALRDKLRAAGIEVKDGRGGSSWRRVGGPL